MAGGSGRAARRTGPRVRRCRVVRPSCQAELSTSLIGRRARQSRGAQCGSEDHDMTLSSTRTSAMMEDEQGG